MKNGLTFVIGTSVFFESGIFDKVEFAANERFDLNRFRRVVELDRAVKITVVGERECLHAEFSGSLHQSIDPARAV